MSSGYSGWGKSTGGKWTRKEWEDWEEYDAKTWDDAVPNWSAGAGEWEVPHVPTMEPQQRQNRDLHARARYYSPSHEISALEKQTARIASAAEQGGPRRNPHHGREAERYALGLEIHPMGTVQARARTLGELLRKASGMRTAAPRSSVWRARPTG